MKPILLLAICLFLPLRLFAEPVTFDEFSLLVRMHESDSYIMGQLAQRRLIRGLTGPQKATLKAQGASKTLLEATGDTTFLLPPNEAAAWETRRAELRKVEADAAAH